MGVSSKKGVIRMENNKLEGAQEALKDFLNEHPELKHYQAEIERRMSKAPTFAARMDILQFMMAERLNTLKGAFSELRGHVLKMKDSLQAVLDETDWNG